MRYFAFLLLFITLCGCGTRHHGSRRSTELVTETKSDQKINSISLGIPVYTYASIKYSRQGKPVLNIEFGEPSIVGVASKPEKWGYFQFPNISRKTDGTLSAKWSMHADAIESYGSVNETSSVSADGGKTWSAVQKDFGTTIKGFLLPGGDRIAVSTPAVIKEADLVMPKPVGETIQNWSGDKRLFYRHSEMPASRQGVFISRLPKGETKWIIEHAKLEDPRALRYSLKGLVPIVWWGDMQTAADGSVIIGTYPGFQMHDDGTIDKKEGVYFYRSADQGRTWTIHGRIPYQPDMQADPKGEKREGFMEPAFEILKDGTYLCIMRTSDGVGHGPMYTSTSKDQGITWSKPNASTPAGVLPQLLELENGVVVLASGRPGVQLRFSNDGKGETWTDPFEMVPFENEKDQVSCGYTSLLATGKDRFLMIYSDFKHLNENKEFRKAIKVREIIVNPR